MVTNPTNLVNPQRKGNRHGGQQAQTQHRGPQPIVIADRSTGGDHAHAPHVQAQAVQEAGAGHGGEGPGREVRDGVAKVQERGRDAAEDDAEFEPGEEGALGGEVDFGFDPDGDVDSWFRFRG